MKLSNLSLALAVSLLTISLSNLWIAPVPRALGEVLQSPLAASIPPAPGLVSWWPGDGNASDIADGNNGTLQGGATFAVGKVGQAFLLDGIDDYVDLGNAPNLQVSSGEFTVDAWVRFDSLSSDFGGDTSILDKMSAKWH